MIITLRDVFVVVFVVACCCVERKTNKSFDMEKRFPKWIYIFGRVTHSRTHAQKRSLTFASNNGVCWKNLDLREAFRAVGVEQRSNVVGRKGSVLDNCLIYGQDLIAN